MSKDFSIVVPVFNRAWCVERALFSAIRFLEFNSGGEIVVVDDGSTDDSVRIIDEFIQQNESIDIRFKFLKQPNSGVCSAKNAGAFASSNYWLIFLDSDDELLPESARVVFDALNDNYHSVLKFFRCVDEVERKVGRYIEKPISRNLNDFVRHGTDGESIPVVRREVFLRYPYDRDVKGFEGLSYIRIIRCYGHATVYPTVVRKYYTQHDDRLSSPIGLNSRSFSLAKGYLRIFLEHYRVLDARSELYIWMRMIFHSLRGILYFIRCQSKLTRYLGNTNS